MSADVEVVFTPWPYDAVARGMALLDEKVPGWRKRIDLSTLDLSDPSFCIAGQLNCWNLVGSDAYHAFDVPDITFDYAVLDDAWREAIAGGAE